MQGTCPDTGLRIPECSCPSCLEELLARHAPELTPVGAVAPNFEATAFVEHLAIESSRRPIVGRE